MSQPRQRNSNSLTLVHQPQLRSLSLHMCKQDKQVRLQAVLLYRVLFMQLTTCFVIFSAYMRNWRVLYWATCRQGNKRENYCFYCDPAFRIPGRLTLSIHTLKFSIMLIHDRLYHVYISPLQKVSKTLEADGPHVKKGALTEGQPTCEAGHVCITQSKTGS